MSDYLADEKKLSIIIPLYNCQEYISKAIESILSQHIKGLQLIIVDDGSTDASGRIVDEYALKYDFIEVIHIDNHGVSHARNVGLQYAVGEWVYFMDSDDELVGAIEPLFSDKASCCFDMIVFAVEFMFSKKESISLRSATPAEIHSRDELKDYFQKMTQECKDVFLNYLWNRIFRRKVIEDNSIQFDEKVQLGEDFLFITKFLQFTSDIFVVEKAYYRYFVRGGNSLVSRFDVHEAARRRVMQSAFCDLLHAYEIDEIDTPVYMFNEGMNLVSSIKKVTQKNCTLSNTSEKIDYIGSFLNDENIMLMMYYLKNGSSMSKKMFRLGLLTKNPIILYSICIAERCMFKFCRK